jgi:hypothetical protein
MAVGGEGFGWFMQVREELVVVGEEELQGEGERGFVVGAAVDME